EVGGRAGPRLQKARVSFVPNFNIGSTYTHHEGNIAKTEGNIIKANKDGLFVGGGPSLTLGLSELFFVPLAALQATSASQAGLERVANTTPPAGARASLNPLRAR